MKKSKILEISLASIALATTTIATPVVLSSCTKKITTEDFKTNEILKNSFIELVGYAPADAKVIQEPNTNNFIVYTGLKEQNKPGITDYMITIGQMLTDAFTDEQINNIGFDKDATSLQNNSTDEKQQAINNLQKGQKLVLLDKLFGIEGPDKNYHIRRLIIPINVTVICDSYKEQ